MNQFSLRPGSGGRLRKAIFIRYLVTALLSISVCVALSWSNTWPFDDSFSDSPSLTTPVILWLFMLFWDVRKASTTASTFKLTISEGTITTENTGLSIPAQQVRSIVKYTDGSYVILGDNPLRPITIPAAIDREKEMEELLSATTGLTIQPQNFQWYKIYLLTLAFVAAMIAAFFMNNLYVATGLGISASGGLLYCWSVLQRDHTINKKMRSLSHFSLILVVALFIRVIWIWM